MKSQLAGASYFYLLPQVDTAAQSCIHVKTSDRDMTAPKSILTMGSLKGRKASRTSFILNKENSSVLLVLKPKWIYSFQLTMSLF